MRAGRALGGLKQSWADRAKAFAGCQQAEKALHRTSLRGASAWVPEKRKGRPWKKAEGPWASAGNQAQMVVWVRAVCVGWCKVVFGSS